MSLRFDDRVAIVTGAGRGLGRSYAVALAARGAAVVVNDLPGDGNEQAGNDVVAEIEEAGGRAVLTAADISDPTGAVAVADAARENFGNVDVLVNNAGVASLAPFDEPLDQFRRVVDINLFGTVNMTHAVWPDLIRGGTGRVVMTSSAIGLWGAPEQAAYAAAKSGLIGLMRSLALEGADHGVTVNCIAPAAQTRLTNARFTKPSRTWRPDLVAPAVLWLAHEDCSATGLSLAVLAGLVARIEVVQGPGFRFDARADLSVEDLVPEVEAIMALEGAVGFRNGHIDALSRPLDGDPTSAATAAISHRTRGSSR